MRKAFAKIGDIVAHLILDFRRKYWVVEREAVNLALRGNFPAQILDPMDFSESYDDPFDLILLPPVPKANSREPLNTFDKTQTESGGPRSSAVKESEVESTQTQFSWLTKASQDLDNELSGMLRATSKVQDPEEPCFPISLSFSCSLFNLPNSSCCVNSISLYFITLASSAANLANSISRNLFASSAINLAAALTLLLLLRL